MSIQVEKVEKVLTMRFRLPDTSPIGQISITNFGRQRQQTVLKNRIVRYVDSLALVGNDCTHVSHGTWFRSLCSPITVPLKVMLRPKLQSPNPLVSPVVQSRMSYVTSPVTVR
jgi:hypothetical protein